MKLKKPDKATLIGVIVVSFIVLFMLNIFVSIQGIVVIDEREFTEVVEVQQAFVIGDPPYLIMKTNSSRNNGVSRTLDQDNLFICAGDILQFTWVERYQWVLFDFHWRTEPADDQPARITFLK